MPRWTARLATALLAILIAGCRSAAPAAATAPPPLQLADIAVSPATDQPQPDADAEDRFQKMLRFSPIRLQIEHDCPDCEDPRQRILQRGTGILYGHIDPDTGTPRVHIITNRHVILRPGSDRLPIRIAARIRKFTPQGFENQDTYIERDTLRRTVRFPAADPALDLAAIDITDILATLAAEQGVGFYGILQQTDLARRVDRPAPLDLGDPIYAAGFPYDVEIGGPDFPIIKAGTLSTVWGQSVGAFPGFLFDGHLYQGMSGSPLFLRPRRPGDQPRLLGIYASTLLLRTPGPDGALTDFTTINAQQILYTDPIPDLITHGIPHPSADLAAASETPQPNTD